MRTKARELESGTGDNITQPRHAFLDPQATAERVLFAVESSNMTRACTCPAAEVTLYKDPREAHRNGDNDKIHEPFLPPPEGLGSYNKCRPGSICYGRNFIDRNAKELGEKAETLNDQLHKAHRSTRGTKAAKALVAPADNTMVKAAEMEVKQDEEEVELLE